MKMTSSRNNTLSLVIMLISIFALIKKAISGDPNILTDFVVPPDLTTANLTGSFFTYSGLRSLFNETMEPSALKVSKVSMNEFSALNGQSVSLAVLEYPVGPSTNPPHVHPRSAELLFLIDGMLEVGFVDTTNKLFTQTLQYGDVFVFPKGLVHFQYNPDKENSATAISAFGSANAGTSSLPNALFATDIDDDILAISFKTDVNTIQKLKAGLAPKP